MSKKYCLFIPSLRGGGAEKMMVVLANYLASKNNNEVFLVVMRSDGVYWHLLSKDVKVVNFKKDRTLSCLLPLSRWIRDNKPNVIFSALGHVNIVAIISQKLSMHPCKIVISERSTISNSPLFKKFFTGYILKKIFKFIYDKANNIIAISRGVKEDLVNTIGISPSKIITINNPAYPSNITKERVNIEKYFNKKPENIILSIGRLEPAKNYLNLLKAVNLLKNDKIALIILGEGSQRKLLENYISLNKMENQVLLLGFVKNPSAWLNSADLFVSSSSWEGFGNAIVEAMAYGLNIISTNCVGPNEILENGKYGILVPVNDSNCLYLAIKNILTNSDLFDKEKIKNKAKEFSENIILNDYERVL